MFFLSEKISLETQSTQEAFFLYLLCTVRYAGHVLGGFFFAMTREHSRE